MQGFDVIARLAVDTASDAVYILTGAVRMEVRWAEVIPTLRIASRIQHPEAPATAAYVNITGDIPGHGLLLFELADALLLCDLLLGQTEGCAKEMGELETSALLELANIVTSSYINAIADYEGCSLYPSPPAFAFDMAGAILQQTLCACAHLQTQTYSIATRFIYHHRCMDGLFLYIPDDGFSGHSNSIADA